MSIENRILDELNINKEVLSILLQDHTTKQNIIWATSDYKCLGAGYDNGDSITIDKIKSGIIRPRSQKNVDEQSTRVKSKAEVFTPSWVCNNQNNLIDKAWFGYEDVFNTEKNNTWVTRRNKIKFENGKTWQEYVNATRLEITCGEAPYLVSRYDTVTGEKIPLKRRIGLLDRKMRVINENTKSKDEWIEWCIKAFKNTYGYEWQGDNLLLARENIFNTFIDYYRDRFKEDPTLKLQKEIAEIIAWNIWQMDGIRLVVPNSCINENFNQMTLFGKEEKKECVGCKNGNIKKHNGTYCKIKNWDTNRTVKFINFLKD